MWIDCLEINMRKSGWVYGDRHSYATKKFQCEVQMDGSSEFFVVKAHDLKNAHMIAGEVFKMEYNKNWKLMQVKAA